jgi:nucleotidyltransferase/DNA polymerase involved in DNA repair
VNAPRFILHVDMDAFYASVEQRDNPALRGRPVIVGGTGGRGVVAAASYEVRKFGVHSAMPTREAMRRCPDAICVFPRIAHYSSVSTEIFAVFHEFTPLVQGLSLDEAFLDVTASIGALGGAEHIAREIKQRIRNRTELTASVGVAPNKLVAKIANNVGKSAHRGSDPPNAITAVPPGGEEQFLECGGEPALEFQPCRVAAQAEYRHQRIGGGEVDLNIRCLALTFHGRSSVTLSRCSSGTKCLHDR